MQAGSFRHRLTTFLIALCAAFAASPSRAETGTGIVQLLSPFPQHFNSALTDNISVSAVAANVFVSLTEVDSAGFIQPYLAEAWEYSEDDLTLTFYLAIDTVFHDGEPVTAHDVLFSYATFRENHPLGERMFRHVIEAEVPDDLTFILHLSSPDPDLLHALAAPFMPILPVHIYGEGEIRRNPANYRPVGSGPFRLTRFVPGETFILERFDDFLKPGLPVLEKITGLSGENPWFAVSALNSGIAHLYTFVDHPDVLELVSENELLLTSSDGYDSIGAMNFLEFNLRKKHLKQLPVRQAIAMAIDPSTLILTPNSAYLHLLDGPFPYFNRFYRAGTTTLKPDPELAEQLLDEAGLVRGEGGIRFETRLTWQPDRTGAAAYMAAAIQSQLEKIGIRLILDAPHNELEHQLLVARWRHHLNLSRMLIWDAPTFTLQPMLSTNNLEHRIGANTSGFRNEQADILLKVAETESDTEIRTQLYGQLQDLIREELPVYFLTTVPYHSIMHRDLFVPVSGRAMLGPMDRVSWDHPEPEADDDEYTVETEKRSGSSN